MDEKTCDCGTACGGATTCPACGKECPNTVAAEEGAMTEEVTETPEEEVI